MKRYRRTRNPRRYGVRHASELLAILIQEIDPATSPAEGHDRESGQSPRVTPLPPVPGNQATFSFYQTAGS